MKYISTSILILILSTENTAVGVKSLMHIQVVKILNIT